MHQNDLKWVPFYMEFAEKLLPYANDRRTLVEKIKAVYADIDMRLPKLEKDNHIMDIDPFTIFGLFNKGITNANRTATLCGIAKEFAVKASVPEAFDGIPVLNNQKATYYFFIGERQEDDIENLWRVFVSAMDYAKTHSDDSKAALIKAYDAALLQKGIKWNLTMALYWICPYEYLNLDSRNRWYICNPKNMPADFIESLDHFSSVPSGERYLQINARCRHILEHSGYHYKNFPELSYYAWITSERANEETRADAKESQRTHVGEAIGDKDVQSVHYWIYSPGDNACMWEEFYKAGIMAIGWGEIGDLTAFSTKDAMKQRMKECIDPTLSYKNAAHATWQFANDMNLGDVVFVKKGMHHIVGKGVVTSGYQFDASRKDKYKHIRQVSWTNEGDWEHPGQAVMKTLTDVTPYTDYVERLNALFEDGDIEGTEEIELDYPVYKADDFLGEVYMNEANYQTLINLLKHKKNIILQGAPGVGKTFAAKRLAYSMMGVKDSSRVMMVQFHQSYSYEDFIMGFRPASSTGFELKKGPFYTFCKKAELDIENDYFFIIDEINRGNLSKIFGELFMLIENDKRGVSLQLLYSDEQFSIPENVYIIGMMNTADRSLAMLDYALRRRFAFFELSPAFETEGFRAYRQGKNNKKLDNLIAAIERLNTAIENDDTLGKGFCIGHSYFCTKNGIDDRWLHAVVAYEIIPLLNEYWFDEPGKVRDWEHVLYEAIQ